MNTFRAAPLGAVLVAKKDVPLYALWHRQAVEGRRPDLRIIAQGLAGASWYQAGWRRQDSSLPVTSLATPAGWSALSAAGAPVVMTQDAEPPDGAGVYASPRREFLVRRGVRRSEEAPDFFTRDLLEGYAVASYRAAQLLQREARPDAAEQALQDAWVASWSFPDIPLFLGYVQASSGRMAEAASSYAQADALFTEKLALAARYRSLPPLVAAIRRQAAEAATYRGVALEKLGDRAGAEQHYLRALAYFPLAQTRFDLAVLAWGKDWAAAEAHLLEAVRLEPGHAAAVKYLAVLRARRR